MKWMTRSIAGLLAGLICLDSLNAEDWPGCAVPGVMVSVWIRRHPSAGARPKT